jgi:PAS domain S-box-containing protein
MAKSRALVRLWAAVAALNLLVFAIIGVALYRGYDQQRAVATMTASNLSRVLEENLTRFIEKIDLTLRAVADEVARQEAAGAIDRDEMDAFLARHDVRLPESLGLRVVNAEGRIEYAVSNAAPGGAEVGDRDHFLGHRDNPLLGLLISKPVVGRMNKVPMVIFAHRRTGKGGSFRGIVHAAVSITALERVFRSVDLGENGVVGLWNPTPTLIARSAPVDATIPAVPSPTLRGLIEARAMPTTYHGVSPLDGIARVYSFRRVGSWPLFITVGIADQDYLMPWWREVRFLSLLALTFVLASLAAAWVIARGIRSQEAARAEAEAARRRSDLILASAADGICGLDTQGRVTFVNATARRLLGWADDAGLGWDFHAVAHHRHTDGRVYPAADCPVSAVLGGTGSMVQVDGEVYWRHDGTCFPVEYTVAAIVEGGEVKGAVNVFRDVGERQRIEGERVRTLAATTALGNILRLALEPLSLEQMLDAALDELLSLSWLKLERQACIFLLDSDHRTLRQVASRNLPPDLCTTVAVGHCLCGRAAVAGEVLFADCHDPRHDIHREGIPEHGHYCVPIGNPADRLGVLNAYVAVGHRRDPEEERFLSMVADTLAGMIQRKRTEETLQLSEERAKALLDAPADAAFLLGPDGTILAGNEAFSVSFAKPVDELVGTRFYDALKPDLAVRRRAAVEAVLGGGRMVETHDQREGREYDNRLFPVRDSHGAVAQVAVFSRDVTEQRRAARAAERALADLARSNEELQQFA